MSLTGEQRWIIEHMLLNIENLLHKFLLSLPIAVFVGFIVLFILQIYQSEKSVILVREKKVSIIVFFSYISIIFQTTILSRPKGIINEIDLIPFNMNGGIRYIVLYCVINAIVFIPLGILMPIIFKKMQRLRNVGLAGFFSSIFIEVCQLILRCGVFQTEDIIMNTVGAILGYWIWYKFLHRK